MAKDSELNKEKTANTESNSNEPQTKSETRQKAEEVQTKNFEEEQQTLKAIDQLSADLLSAAEVATRKSETTALRQSIFDLNSAIQTLKTATVLSVSRETTQPNPVTQNSHNCGCGEPKTPNCCVEIYGSGIRVLKSTWDDGPKLELMVAIEAKGMKAVFPGLTSTIVVDKNAGWTKTYWPVTRCCVPCDQTISVPISVEAIDMDKLLGGNPEYGVTTGFSIPINCNCNICSIRIEVPLKGGGLTKNAVIEVEISARRIPGECCC